MGNRAYVVFENGKNRSPAIYLQWNGGPESIYAFLQALKDYGADQHSPEYSCARFVQLVGNYLGGTLSLGIVPFREYGQLAEDDNGLYVVTPSGVRRMIGVPGGEPGAQQFAETWSLDLRWLTQEEIEAEYRQALQHHYWNPEPGHTALLDDIHAANDRFFMTNAGRRA